MENITFFKDREEGTVSNLLDAHSGLLVQEAVSGHPRKHAIVLDLRQLDTHTSSAEYKLGQLIPESCILGHLRED